MNAPLHPALVHLPLGLALAMPLVAVGVALAVARSALPRRALWLAVALQACVVIGGLAAASAGDREEKVVRLHVARELVHEHEERAELFLWAAGATLALTVGLAALPVAATRAALALAAATSVTAGLGLFAGKAGGELVYRHGAAQAFASTGAAPSLSKTEPKTERNRHRAVAGRED